MSALLSLITGKLAGPLIALAGVAAAMFAGFFKGKQSERNKQSKARLDAMIDKRETDAETEALDDVSLADRLTRKR